MVQLGEEGDVTHDPSQWRGGGDGVKVMGSRGVFGT
jgi:hypothetical protein